MSGTLVHLPDHTRSPYLPAVAADITAATRTNLAQQSRPNYSLVWYHRNVLRRVLVSAKVRGSKNGPFL